jgi:hypothetical protein
MKKKKEVVVSTTRDEVGDAEHSTDKGMQLHEHTLTHTYEHMFTSNGELLTGCI